MTDKPTPLSGFPELLPEHRAVERQVIASLSRTFELHGFANIETRAVEPIERLSKGGEVDKEIYVLRRLHADEGAGDSGLGLHFDLTVPFARYVLEHSGKLEFPFRRYQIQPAWRGERPQEGRYRQFTQADIDVVGRDELPFHHDVEVVRVMVEALDALPLPNLSFQVNNRKLIQGFYRGLGIPDVTAAIRQIDKLDKQPAEAVAELLVSEAGATEEQAAALPRARDHPGLRHQLRRAGPRARRRGRAARRGAHRARRRHRGLRVRRQRPRERRGQPPHRPRPRLLHRHRPRGLHGRLRAAQVGRRGRAVRRAGQRRPDDVPRRRHQLRRLPHPRPALRRRRSSSPAPRCPARCWSRWSTRSRARPARRSRPRCAAAASTPRWPRRAQKFGKQIRYAERRGIPYVWFPGAETHTGEVKDIRSGEQVAADPTTWTPPEERDTVIRTHDAG